MAYKHVFLPKAQDDYDGIVDYLVNELKSKQAARNFVDEFDHQVNLVCENPRLYALSRFKELSELGYHSFLINNYIALYRVFDEIIVIAHVFHQKQNYASLVRNV